jgi:hypothetical protein
LHGKGIGDLIFTYPGYLEKVLQNLKVWGGNNNSKIKGLLDAQGFGAYGFWPKGKGSCGVGDQTVGILPVGVYHFGSGIPQP